MSVFVILLLADHSVVGDMVVSQGRDGNGIEAGFSLSSFLEFRLR